MCGRYELKTGFPQLPEIAKKELPKGFSQNYSPQELIKPGDPVLAIRQENSKISSSLMLWGLLAEWSKDPLNSPRPFNARAETINSKVSFRSAWRYRRALLPATAFLEKGFRIRKRDSSPFFLAGLWNRWLGADGSEIESCTVITTKASSLIKPFHSRMPVIISARFANQWLEDQYGAELKSLGKLLISFEFDFNSWIVESLTDSCSMHTQMKLF